ncbi:unnamed protein product [Pelagomonas calceolata]|uniref:Ubiquitin-like domain-containing protein n=1 Tax=Pelagomonas calceolata TaxID=35677 RepID=A0A8J2T304_9STRA|nr:unnamed protein product [Pelagomonas calceolata]
MQADSAPATRCSISVRQGGKRVALMELDPSTTLRECLQQLPATVDAPALVDDAWRGPLPRDGSTCGAAVPLRPDQINETLQALGWFPSGVLELGDTAPAARPTSSAATAPPSALFAAVASRHDAADALTGNGISGKIRTSQADAAEDARRDAAAARIDAQRATAATKRDAKTASLVWQMMAKRHACGRSTLREEDRVYLVLERPSRAARYCFFSAQDTWGRARDALGGAGALARSDGATASANDTLGALRARGWLGNFAVVRFVDAPGPASSTTAPAAPPAAAPPSPGAAGTPADATPAPPAPPADAYVVSFEGKEHRIAGVTTVGELRDEAAKACGLATCRLVYKGDLTRDPSQKLEATKLRPGAKCLVMRARR